MGTLCLEARDGHEALRLWQDRSRPVDLLMTDVVMPGKYGRELANRLVATCSALKVLYTSGYTNQGLNGREGLAEDIAFLQKPYSAKVVAQKVREVLNNP